MGPDDGNADVDATELNAAELVQADFDNDGHGDLVMIPRLAAQSGRLRVWRFVPEYGRFLTHAQQLYVRDARSVTLRGEPALSTVELLRAGDPDADNDERAPILIRRGGKVAHVIANDAPEDGDQFLWFGDESFGPSAPFVDANFDGHPDLVLQREHCTGNCYYAFFLFKPKLGRFVYDRELSALSSPEFDAVNEQIHEFYHRGGGGEDHRAARYRFVDGALQKLWESDQDTTVRRVLGRVCLEFLRIVWSESASAAS
jgi:hypothetical protein